MARAKKDIEKFSGSGNFARSIRDATEKTYGIVQPFPNEHKQELDRVKKIIDENKVHLNPFSRLGATDMDDELYKSLVDLDRQVEQVPDRAASNNSTNILFSAQQEDSDKK